MAENDELRAAAERVVAHMSLFDDRHNAAREAAAVARAYLAHPPLTRELTESQLSLLNDVAGLCHSEANRWERSAPKTAEHWRNAAIELQATYLAAHATHTEEYEPYMPAGTYFQDDLDGGRLVRKPPLHDKLPLTRERVAAAVRELFINGNGDKATRLVLVDDAEGYPTEPAYRRPWDLGGLCQEAVVSSLCRWLGVTEGE